MALRDEQLEDIQWALDNLLPYQSGYHRARRYYQGAHQRMIDNERLKNIFGRLFRDFRLNLCKPVVDSLVDRLQVSGFSTGENEEQNALDVWKRNHMARRAGQVHLEAIMAGDAYVLVWPNEMNRPTLYPHRAHEVVVDYSSAAPGFITRAAKLWRPDADTVRLTVYRPERVERYVARRLVSGGLPSTQPVDPYYQGSDLLASTDVDLYGDGGQFFPTGSGGSQEGVAGVDKAQSFTEYTDDGEAAAENPFGVVPVFHFANNSDLGERGVSELWDAMPVQDMLNYLAFQILVNAEYQGHRQRWATGIEVPIDADGNPINPFKAGAETMMIAGVTTQGDTDPRFGEFSAGDLNQLDNIKRSAALDIAQVSQTPPHYFFVASNLVSGESQKTAEQKLDAKVTDRQIAFGEVWAQAVALAVRMERGAAQDGLELDTNWKDTKPRNELESWQVAQLKSERGVPDEQILVEMGYAQEQIEKFRDMVPMRAEAPSPLEQLLAGGDGRELPPLDELS